MSVYPCDECGHRFRGPAAHYYPALTDGADSLRAKKRLCPDCLWARTQWLEDHLTRVDEDAPLDGAWESRSCLECSTEDDVSHRVFVTLYPRGQDRQDYFGDTCAACKGAALAHLAIAD